MAHTVAGVLILVGQFTGSSEFVLAGVLVAFVEAASP